MWFTASALLLIQAFTLFAVSTLGRTLMTTQQDIDNAVAVLNKAKTEILATIADLNTQIADAGVTEQIDTSALTAVADSLDNIVPDALPELPAEIPAETPAEVVGDPAIEE